MEDLQQDHLEEMDLKIDDQVRQQLTEAGKWSKFIAIIMFVACGLILVFGVIAGSAMTSTLSRLGSSYSFFGEFSPGILIGIIILVVAIIGVVYYFLYNFGLKIKNALLSENNKDFNDALRSLKVFFIITTILAILSLLNSLKTLFS